MEKHTNNYENRKSEVEEELSVQFSSPEFKWKLLSYDTNTISIYLQSLKYEHPDESNHDNLYAGQNQASETPMFWNTKAIIKDSIIENIKQMILSSFNNSNTDLLQNAQEDLEGMYKLMKKLMKLL